MDGIQQNGARSRAPDARGWSVAEEPQLATRSDCLLNPGDMLEYLQWADAVVEDRRLLLQLIRRFEHSNAAEERVSLLQLALEIRQIHQEFESAWVYGEQLGERLEPRYLELDALRQRLERLPASSAAWNAAAADWGAKVLQLSDIEEACFDQRKIAGASMLGWTGQLLQARVSLIGEVRTALAMSDGGQAAA